MNPILIGLPVALVAPALPVLGPPAVVVAVAPVVGVTPAAPVDFVLLEHPAATRPIAIRNESVVPVARRPRAGTLYDLISVFPPR